MANEVAYYLKPKDSGRFIDATVGSGGHAIEVIKKGGTVLGIDLDPGLLNLAEVRLSTICPEKNCYKLVKGNFRKISEIAKKEGFYPVSGVIFDLGVSNLHLTDPERGFSFANPEADLDMRLDPENQSVRASDLLNALRQDQLRELFEAVMDPGASLWLTKRVIRARELAPIQKVGDFLKVLRGLRSKPGLNPATLPMLALRIAVGSELSNLREALPEAFGLLEKKGRLVVITFHSSEDKIVKDFFRELENKKTGKVLTKDAVVPKEIEVNINPRSRSAKMRVCEKI